MRILLVIPELSIGGTERQALLLAKELQELGHTVRLLALRPSRRPLPFEEGVDTVTANVRSYSPGTFLLVLRQVATFKPDIIHSFLFGFDFLPNLAARLLRVPCIVSSRRQLATWRKRHHLIWQNLGNLLVHAVIANSRASADYCFSQERFLARGHIFSIPNVYEPRHCTDSGALPEPGSPALVNIANFWPGKGQAMLIRAFSQFVRDAPQASLWLAGEGCEQETCRRLVGDLDIEGHVTFLGARDDINRILAQADLYVHSSTMESSPNAILEAMGAGIPIIATACAGVSELLDGGDIGTLVPADDESSLVAAIDYAMGIGREEVANKSKRAKAVAMERHEPQSVATRYAELYGRLLAASTGKDTAPRRVGIYLLGDRSLPSAWFRVFQYIPEMQKAGLDLQLFELPGTGNGACRQFIGCFLQAIVRMRQLSHIRKFDTVLIQKGLTPARLRGPLRSILNAGQSFIYDVDDRVQIATPVLLPGVMRRFQNIGEPVALMRHASCITAGNHSLKEDCERLNGSVSRIPTTVDTDRYWYSPVRLVDIPVIGWSGSSGTNPYVNLVAPTLRRLARNHQFIFRIMSSDLRGVDQSAFEGVTLEFIPWSREHEVDHLRAFSVGIMPLPNTEWEQGKCGFKALSYMALAVPPVCSPVGVNNEIVEDGVSGFLAATDSEWHDSLSTLLTDTELRRCMGEEARRVVAGRYSVSRFAPAICDILGKDMQPG